MEKVVELELDEAIIVNEKRVQINGSRVWEVWVHGVLIAYNIHRLAFRNFGSSTFHEVQWREIQFMMGIVQTTHEDFVRVKYIRVCVG